MKGPDGFVQAYNAQVAVDDLQLIVGQAVTQESNDKKQLMPMIATITQQSGETPTLLLADAGYCSDANLAAIAATPIDAYISTRKQTTWRAPGPLSARPPADDRDARRSDDAQAAHEGRRGGLCRAQSDRRTGDSGRSSRRAASGSSSCGAWRRCKGNGRWCARRTTF